MPLIRSVFQDELDSVSQTLFDLSVMVSDSMARATKSVMTKDLKMAEEVITSDAVVVRRIKVKNLASVPTGFGANFSVDEGNWYVNGVLVYAPYQNIILGKYSIMSY